VNKDLLNKILITLGFILIYRILAYVPIPGVDLNVIKEFFDSNSSNALGMAKCLVEMQYEE
jgi:preprotein translocase subunit SecY